MFAEATWMRGMDEEYKRTSHIVYVAMRVPAEWAETGPRYRLNRSHLYRGKVDVTELRMGTLRRV